MKNVIAQPQNNDTTRKFTAALVQMDSQDNKQKNLQDMLENIREAAKHGADLIIFPELSLYQGNDLEQNAEEIPGEVIDKIAHAAEENQVYIVTGTFHEKVAAQNNTGEVLYNTSIFISPEGKIICKYRKNHMFDVTLNGFGYRESDRNKAGNEIVLADTKLGRFGMSICYDLRFPEQFRLQALNGAQVLLLPASFVMRTGKDHWEPLLKARAIENACYVLAVNQIGNKPDGCTAYGRTMAIDPWGNVIAMASDRTQIIYAEIDLGMVDEIRGQIPVLENRRDDLYQLRSDKINIYAE